MYVHIPQKGSKGRKLFGKLGNSKDDLEVIRRKGMKQSCDHSMNAIFIVEHILSVRAESTLYTYAHKGSFFPPF